MITHRDEQMFSVRSFMYGGSEYVRVRALSKALPSGARAFSELRLIPGASIGNHTHTGALMVYIIEGEAFLTEGNETHVIHEGESAYIKPNVVHNIVNNSDLELKILVCIVNDA